MKLHSLRILWLIILLLVGVAGFAGAEVSTETPSPNLTTDQWVGHNFLFLAMPADKQAEGYEIFPVDQAIPGFQGERWARISYAEHVGKQVTVTAVASYTAGDNQFDHVVYFTELETGKKLVGRTMRGQLEGLVLAEDLLKARQQFYGQTIYTKRRTLEAAYNPLLNQLPMAITSSIGGAVKVIDVYAGIQSVEPIWLVILVNGRKAVLPIAYSWTNQPTSAWTKDAPWQNALFMEDPRVSLRWSKNVWGKIEAGVVEVGMTKAQVCLSWGPPEHINTEPFGKGVWYYGNQMIKFTGDNVTSKETVQ